MKRPLPLGLLAAAILLSPIVRAEESAAPAPAAGIVFEPGTPAWAEVLAKAKAASKPAFVDFSTTWCGWCRRLEKDTFSQASVGEVMKGFVNVQLDAEKGEGPDLAKRYGVRGFPTMLVVDAAGDEVDRIVGYLPPAEFTKEAQRILRGDGTIPSLRAKVAAAPDDLEAGVALGSKLATTKPDESTALFEALVAKAGGRDRATQGKVRLAWVTALVDADRPEPAFAQAEAILKDLSDTPAAAEVVPALGRAAFAVGAARALPFLDRARPLAKDAKARFALEDLTIALHREQIAAALARQGEAAGDDPDLLNQVAWTCFEQKVNVREALGWAHKAAELSQGAPEILDTLANLQWLLGQQDEAIATEEQALAKAEPPMKPEFEATLARWRATRAAMKAAGAIPATPLVPMKPKEPPSAPK